MTICPIAIAVGCKKCPIFKICPVKSLIGDVPKASAAKPAARSTAKPAAKAATKSAPARKKAKK